MRITFISDTHNKHAEIINDLPGGDVLIHAGDISSAGKEHEVRNFCNWFSTLDSYKHKIFIAGNHDFLFQDHVDKSSEIINFYENIRYLQDDLITIDGINIYGSPWQPRFFDWAFNCDRGDDIKKHWDKIPENVDILITHGPAFGYLDTVVNKRDIHLGCEDLNMRINEINPKIHVFGHIHTGYGYTTSGVTHFINACALNEKYNYHNKPITIDWDKETNEIINFI